MLEYKLEKVISTDVLDSFVRETYGKPHYQFQQQDGCKGRGRERISVPMSNPEDFENDTIPEKVNGNEMGVSFAAWIARDPEQKFTEGEQWDIDNGLSYYWSRNFYPHIDMIFQDLFEKGLIEAGDYVIDIDW